MIASSAPAWAVWLAVGLGVAGCFVWGFVFVAARRLYRQAKPTLGPLMAMFAPPPPDSFGGMVTRCDYRGVEGDRCELSSGHDGPHEWPTLSEALSS